MKRKYKPKYLWVVWVIFTDGGRCFLDNAILRYDQYGNLQPEWIEGSIAIGKWSHIIKLKRYMEELGDVQCIKLQKIPIDENGVVQSCNGAGKNAKGAS